MNTTVTLAGGKPKAVKNLGWLIRHASQVTHITLSDRDDGARCGCKLTALLDYGATFSTCFNSLQIAREWITRRSLKHAKTSDLVTLVSETNP